MGDLIPTDIFCNHVFTRLSVKSLAHCKGVCKAWNTEISDEEFVRKRFLGQNQHRVCLRFGFDSSSYLVNYEANDETIRTSPVAGLNIKSIIGSSNGLFCCIVEVSVYLHLAIWNPSTNEFKLIPDSSSCLTIYRSYRVGFHFDYVTNDASIVVCEPSRRIVPPHLTRTHIYSAKTNSWKIIESFDETNGFLRWLKTIGRMCGINGSIYWIVANKREYILQYDMEKNTYKTVGFPDQRVRCWAWNSFFERKWTLNLMTMGLTLGLSCFSSGERVTVWTLKEDQGESIDDKWYKLVDLDTCTLQLGTYGVVEPLCLINNHQFLMLNYTKCMRSEHDTKFIVYDIETEKIETCWSIKGINSHDYHSQAVAYIETIVSLQAISSRHPLTVSYAKGLCFEKPLDNC